MHSLNRLPFKMRISIKAMLTLCYLCFARKVAIEQNEKEYLCIIVDTPENELLADFKRICGENIIKLMEPKKLVKKANFAACVNTKKENLKTMVFDNENVHNLCRYFIENAYNQMLKYFEFESQEQTNKKSSAENENCSIPVSILEASKVFLSNSDQKMQVFTNMKFEEIFKPVSGLEEFLKEAYWEILNISCEKDYLKNLFFLSSLIKTPFSEETILEFYKYNENKSLCIQHIEEDFFYDIKNIYNLFRGLFESSFDINTSVKKIILLLSPQKHFLNHIFQTCWDEINQINFDSVTMENITKLLHF
ncbi:hypothetical protein EDEG_02934 [Edhazardia aedis USNM 41457]|uniref:Uncharacterized protein n=1 Tax=Edhazardia aedis (strain USNM 41457) TaxID=1003232 RepID=J9DMV3_EDHAE|nr:hypothetical protein EDEG_02934 [Edhazardia aedis USNM 41457]|eukprot:EJW02672.1 hypothetical protein EDEG_02934 [Edhazardia aedis USNM 41457]